MSSKTSGGRKPVQSLMNGSRKSLKLNLGSGYTRKDEFISVDIDATCEPDIVDDIRTLSKIKSNSVKEIFTAHTLEHIYPKDLFRTLRCFYRVLKPNGFLKIIVPDVEDACQQWIAKTITGKQFELIVLGSDPTATKYQTHHNIFYSSKLERYLHVTGFVRIFTHLNYDNHELIAEAYKPRRNNGFKG